MMIVVPHLHLQGAKRAMSISKDSMAAAGDIPTACTQRVVHQVVAPHHLMAPCDALIRITRATRAVTSILIVYATNTANLIGTRRKTITDLSPAVSLNHTFTLTYARRTTINATNAAIGMMIAPARDSIVNSMAGARIMT